MVWLVELRSLTAGIPSSPSNHSVAHGFHNDTSYHSNLYSESAAILTNLLKEPLTIDRDKRRGKCKLCSPLPSGYLDKWNLRPIRLDMWMGIFRNHKNLEIQDEWTTKEYPNIEWENFQDGSWNTCLD